MEIKRELVQGELDSFGKAALPAIAALGGMAVPAIIYAALNWDGPGLRGWAIPMATDIAFSVGVLTLLERRIPRALIVFVTALAIVDDIGGILVIALFYGHGANLAALGLVAACCAALLVANRLGWENMLVYGVLGCALWLAMHVAGVHATLAGVALGLAIPSRPLDAGGSLRALHAAVAFGVVPLFALTNAGVSVRGTTIDTLASPVALGVALGLFVGKTIGIFATTAFGVRAGLAPRPGDCTSVQLLGSSLVAGIGFTVSLFVATLAFASEPILLHEAKLGILVGSVASAFVGALVLRFTPPARGSPSP
jgi:Na+:H+ antiporter, NhaA family